MEFPVGKSPNCSQDKIMGIKIFTFHQGRVRGPFAPESFDLQRLASDCLIWQTGLREWLPPNLWEKQNLSPMETPLPPPPPVRHWRVRIVDQDYGPIRYGEMLDLLKGREHYDHIWIWTEGYKDWQNIFGFHKLMDDLGLGKRQHPRVAIKGEVEMKSESGLHRARLISISEGGLGLGQFQGLQVGLILNLVVRSPALPGPLVAKAEIVYIENESYAGLKFSEISAETKNQIINYVHSARESLHASPA